MTAPSYVTVEEAIGLPGLRVAFTRGVPGPDVLIAHRERMLRDHFYLPLWF